MICRFPQHQRRHHLRILKRFWVLKHRLDIAPAISEISNVDDSETDAQDGAAEQIFIEQLPQIGESARMVRIPEELGEVWIGPFEANGFYYAGSYVYIQTRPPRWQVR